MPSGNGAKGQIKTNIETGKTKHTSLGRQGVGSLTAGARATLTNHKGAVSTDLQTAMKSHQSYLAMREIYQRLIQRYSKKPDLHHLQGDYDVKSDLEDYNKLKGFLSAGGGILKDKTYLSAYGRGDYDYFFASSGIVNLTHNLTTIGYNMPTYSRYKQERDRFKSGSHYRPSFAELIILDRHYDTNLKASINRKGHKELVEMRTALESAVLWYAKYKGHPPKNPHDLEKYMYIEYNFKGMAQNVDLISTRLKGVPSHLSRKDIAKHLSDARFYSKLIDNQKLIIGKIGLGTATQSELSTQLNSLKAMKKYLNSKEAKDTFGHFDVFEVIEGARQSGENIYSQSDIIDYDVDKQIAIIEGHITKTQTAGTGRKTGIILGGTIKKVGSGGKVESIDFTKQQDAMTNAWGTQKDSEIKDYQSQLTALKTIKPADYDQYSELINKLNTLNFKLNQTIQGGKRTLFGYKTSQGIAKANKLRDEKIKALTLIAKNLASLDKTSRRDFATLRTTTQEKNKGYISLTGETKKYDLSRRVGYGFFRGTYEKLYKVPNANQMRNFETQIKLYGVVVDALAKYGKPYANLTEAEKKQMKEFEDQHQFSTSFAKIDESEAFLEYLDYRNRIKKDYSMTRNSFNQQVGLRAGWLNAVKSNLLKYADETKDKQLRAEVQKDLAGVDFNLISKHSTSSKTADELDYYQLQALRGQLIKAITIKAKGEKATKKEQIRYNQFGGKLDQTLKLETRLGIVNKAIEDKPFTPLEINQGKISLDIIRSSLDKKGLDELPEKEIDSLIARVRELEKFYGKGPKDYVMRNKSLRKKYEELLQSQEYLQAYKQMLETEKYSRSPLKTDDMDIDSDDDQWLTRFLAEIDKYAEEGFGVSGALFNTMSRGGYGLMMKTLSAFYRNGLIASDPKTDANIETIDKGWSFINTQKEEFKQTQEKIRRTSNLLERDLQQQNELYEQISFLVTGLRGAEPQNIRDLKTDFQNLAGYTWRQFRDHQDRGARLPMRDTRSIIGIGQERILQYQAELKTIKTAFIRGVGNYRQPIETPDTLTTLLREANEQISDIVNNQDLRNPELRLRYDNLVASRLDIIQRLGQYSGYYINQMRIMYPRLQMREYDINNYNAEQGRRFTEIFRFARVNAGILYEGYWGGRAMYRVSKYTTKKGFTLLNNAVAQGRKVFAFGFVIGGEAVKQNAEERVQNIQNNIITTSISTLNMEQQLPPPPIENAVPISRNNPVYIPDKTPIPMPPVPEKPKPKPIFNYSTFNEYAPKPEIEGVAHQVTPYRPPIPLPPTEKPIEPIAIREQILYAPKKITQTRYRDGYGLPPEKEQDRTNRKNPQMIKGRPIEYYEPYLDYSHFDEYNKDKGVKLKRKLQVIRDKRIQELLNRPIGCDNCKKEEKYKDLIKVNRLF